MNKRTWTILTVALLMIGGTGFGIKRMQEHQRLTPPGVLTSVIPGSQRLNVFLPTTVQDYGSVIIPTDPRVLNGLPQDTSLVQRQYVRPNHKSLWEPIYLSVVLMGTDRTSIHKPQFCLRGQGWDIDGGNSDFDKIRIQSPHPYDLEVMKILNTREVTDRNGKPMKIRGIYVYWFVADNDLTADHWTRMRKMATHLLSTGELERWAYVNCFMLCLPGEEEATYARMKEFIATAVPQFQKAANPPIAEVETSQRASR